MNSPKRTVGLMTLSNVINFGSALQTYATIKTVEKAGYKFISVSREPYEKKGILSFLSK